MKSIKKFSAVLLALLLLVSLCACGQVEASRSAEIGAAGSDCPGRYGRAAGGCRIPGRDGGVRSTYFG